MIQYYLEKSNLVVVGNNPPGKSFHKGSDAFILDPIHECGVLCQFVSEGKRFFTTKNPEREKC
jgi:hypothetical protein